MTAGAAANRRSLADELLNDSRSLYSILHSQLLPYTGMLFIALVYLILSVINEGIEEQKVHYV